MHVHSHTHGVSSVRTQQDATASARSATSSATPFSVVADGDGTSAADAGAAFTSGNDAQSGTAASNAFSSLSGNIQAMLLGVGQNGQSGLLQAENAGLPATTTGALQAYGQTSNLSG